MGQGRIQYKLRDWLFSRQRYWGEPFPVLFDTKTGKVYGIDKAQLPALLPELNNFEPVGSDDPNSLPEPPLARVKEWMTVKGIILNDHTVRIIEGDDVNQDSIEYKGHTYAIRTFQRDPNSMPNWAGSCWYYLRYFDPRNDEQIYGADVERYWSFGKTSDGDQKSGAVDLYVGGQSALKQLALENEKVQGFTKGKTVQKVIAVMNPKKKLVNIVVK